MENEELKQLYDERDELERDIQEIEDDMRLIELSNDNFEELEEYNDLDRALNDVTNHANYITSWIQSIEEGYTE